MPLLENGAAAASLNFSNYVNPQWARLLDVLQMNVRYHRCEGIELRAGERTILDFLSGYCVHNTGHNHPAIVSALHEELDRHGAAMLQSHVPELAGELARRLCDLAGDPFQKVFFACSGSEGVEAAIKFARKTTARTKLLYCDGAFHGLTCGALSLMGDPFWRDQFGPMLDGAENLPFGDLEALEKKLATRKIAAFFVEPVQSEAGIKVPSGNYLSEAASLCHRYGTLLVLDEVQTGLFRTGTFLAAHQFQVKSDMVVLAKALSGGLVPVSAVLMTDHIYRSVYDSLKGSIVHTSTFGENALAMRAGLATLDVLEQEGLADNARAMGEYLRGRLRECLAGYSMVAEVRGVGLLCGVEFRPPSQISWRVPFEAFRAIHPAMFGQILVMRLFRDWNLLTQICGNNFMVLKCAPPLTVTGEQIDRFVEGLTSVVDLMHASPAYWSEALGLARRAANI